MDKEKKFFVNKKWVSALIALLVVGVLLILYAFVGLVGVTSGSDEDLDTTEDVYETTEDTYETTDKDEYYAENATAIIARYYVEDSDSVLSEAEVIELLTERGFGTASTTTYYSMDGEYGEPIEISATSEDQHPLYEAYYETEDGDIWYLMIVDGDIMAFSLSYLYDEDTPIIISEHEYLTSYDNTENIFYQTIPNEDVIVVEVVDEIIAEVLATLGG